VWRPDDAKDFLSRFGKFRVPVGKQLQGMMNSLALMIEGYDDDPREIYAIPEVRSVLSNSFGSDGPTGSTSAIWTPRTS
jgi:hypothetical protein